jgi:hypothetical protein
MDLIKTLFESIRDQLKTQVPEIRWIDENNEQLSLYEEPPVAYPCALIDTESVDFENTEDSPLANAPCLVSVTFGFKTLEATNHLTPNSNAFAYSATLTKAIDALHGHEVYNSCSLNKRGYQKQPRPGIRVYKALFEVTISGRNV